MPIPSPADSNDTPICSICKSRPATKLCDFPTGRSRYVGHPPRYLMDQAKNTKYAFKEIQMQWAMTCDKPLCDKCAISTAHEIDFCPTHIQDLQSNRKK